MSQSDRLLDDILVMDLRRLTAKYPDHNIRCGVLLMREEDGKILIVKEKPRGEFVGNIYGPPKGSANWRDREYFDVATRELIEETGISVRDAQVAGPEIIIFHSYFREILFLFPIIIRSPPDPRPDYNEIEECRWMSFDEFEECHEEPAYVRRLISDLHSILVSGISLEDKEPASLSQENVKHPGDAKTQYIPLFHWTGHRYSKYARKAFPSYSPNADNNAHCSCDQFNGYGACATHEHDVRHDVSSACVHG